MLHLLVCLLPLAVRSVTWLSQSDFAQGTYRIRTSGEYRLSENIVFNPNPGTSNELDAWLPRANQTGTYPIMPYNIGFFAAITLEVSDIVLDLNGYSLSMSRAFYLQQRWGALIVLGSSPFIQSAGPADFGVLNSASNVVIRNGSLGLTSHHAIQGNNVTGGVISDLTIENFEVGGIALNGIVDFEISRITIRNSLTDVPTSGLYAGARFLLRFYRQMMTAGILNASDSITFVGGRTLTLQDVVKNLEAGMNLVFDNYVNGNKSSLIPRVFKNSNGLPDCSALYGININGKGPAINGLGKSSPVSRNVTIRDVTISNLTLNPVEKVRIAGSPGAVGSFGATGNVFDIVMAASNQLTDPPKATYVSNVLADAQIAMEQYAPNNSSLPVRFTLKVAPVVVSWATMGTPLNSSTYQLFCNVDIQFHVMKGPIGLRVDGTSDLILENIVVKNVTNVGALGSNLCGTYTMGATGGHPKQTLPGYRGTSSYGLTLFASSGSIKNVNISGIVSARGSATGIAISGSRVQFDPDTGITSVTAASGTQSAPNQDPLACGVYLIANNNTNTVTGSEVSVMSKDITGRAVCSNPRGTDWGNPLPVTKTPTNIPSASPTTLNSTTPAGGALKLSALETVVVLAVVVALS